MTPRLATEDDGPARSPTVTASAGVGVLAGAIGYLATYLVIVREVRDVFGDDVAAWKGVAWYFYNAHLVDVETTGRVGGFGGSSTVDFVARSGSTSAELLYVIPPLVLLATGAVLATQLRVPDVGDAVAVGAPVTVGYAAVLGLGTLVAESSADGSVFGIEIAGSMAPELVPALALGVLYPLAFATAGAVLAAAFSAR